MTTTYVRAHGGVPALFLDDQPVPPIVAYVGPRYVGTFLSAGVQLYTFGVPGTWWVGPGEYDFGGIDAYLSDLRRPDSPCLLHAPNLPGRTRSSVVG